MPSATTNLRIEKQTGGSNNNTWGTDHLNVNEDMTDEAIAGVLTLTMTSNHTLTNTDYVSNQARNAVYNLTGGNATYIVTIPSVNARKVVRNASGYDQSVKTSGGSAVTVRNGTVVSLICDGTNCYLDDLTLDQIKAAAADVSLNSHKLTSVTDPSSAQDAATKNYVDTRKLNEFVAPNASVSWGSQKLTSLANGTVSSDAVNYGQLTAAVFSAGLIPAASAAGQTIIADGSLNPNWGPLDLANAQARTGILPIANGGTGAGTAAGFRVAAVPALATNALKYLRVNSGETDTEWAAVGGSTSAQSGSTFNVTASDNGVLFICSHATPTASLVAAATAGAGFKFSVIMVTNGGVLTLDPNSTESIDGSSTSKNVYIGDGIVDVWCDGTAWRTSRRRGYVLVGNTTVGSAVASVDFETAFTDAELIGMTIEFSGVSHNDGGNQYVGVQGKKSGAYQTSGYLGSAIFPGGTLANTTATRISMASGQVAGTTLISGQIHVDGQLSAVAGGSMIRVLANEQASGSGVFNIGGTGTAAALTGVRVIAAAGNIDTGTFSQYAVRA